jgi:hypothetical protein
MVKVNQSVDALQYERLELIKIKIMNGTVQLCKADVCIKADGDFAKAMLLIISAVLLIAVVASFAK